MNYKRKTVTRETPPLLSVIVANYNAGSYIRECLDSILEQNFKNIEIVISDDASTDNSPTIIKEFEKKYPDIVKGIYNPVNKGVAQTRHEAILRAKGEFITTLDSDDYYYDHRKLEKEMELIFHYKKRTGKDIISFSNIVMVKADKSIIRIWGNAHTLKEGFIFKDIITRACMIPRDFIMKKEAYFEVGGYDSRFLIYEDWDLKIRLAQKYEYYYTGINGTAYRKHGAGLSSLPIKNNIKWLKKVFKNNIKLIPKIERKETFNNFKNFVKVTRENHRKRKKK